MSRAVFALLVVLALVLAAVVGFLGWDRARPSAARTRGAITSLEARDVGLDQAGPLAEQVLSYDWKTLDADARAVARVGTPAFDRQYAATLRRVRAATVRNRLRLEASAVATSVVSARRDQVVALVFLNQTTFAPRAAAPRRDQKRVLVTLTRDGGEWRVSAMDSF